MINIINYLLVIAIAVTCVGLGAVYVDNELIKDLRTEQLKEDF